MEEIKEKLTQALEEYDLLIETWAELKAFYNKASEMKKVKLATIADGIDAKTNAEKDRRALTHQAYKDTLNDLYKKEVEYHIAQGRKDLLERKIDVYRSLGSWDNKQINNLI